MDIDEKISPHEQYRTSHASPDYGHVYEKTYASGYYRNQWDLIERPILQTILSDLRSQGKTTCLDFACGTGRITRVLTDAFPSVEGVDVSATMLARARSNCRAATFIEQDITAEPLDRKYDVVTAFRFFLNAEPALRREALKSIHACLADSGCLILNIHVNSRSLLGIAYRIRNFVMRRTIAKTCSFAEIEGLLEEAGFAVCRTVWYSYLPRIGWRFPKLTRRLMLPIERFAKRMPFVPREMAQSFIIVASISAAPGGEAQANS